MTWSHFYGSWSGPSSTVFKKVATITNESSKILRLEAALSSHMFNDILRRDSLIELSWYDKVFKDLIDDWQNVSRVTNALERMSDLDV